MNLLTVRRICHKCGENVQCSIGQGSEGVFVVSRTSYYISEGLRTRMV